MSEFPLVAWLSGFTTVYDTGGDNFYIDCPVCKGRKKLGVSRSKRLFHCFRCKEGGHGGKRWSGASDLLGFVKIVEGLSTRDAASFLNTLQGLPDIPIPERKYADLEIPTGVPASSLWEGHTARKFLKRRNVEHLIESASFVADHEIYSDRLVFQTAFLSQSTGFEARAILDHMKPKALYPEWQDTTTLYTPSWLKRDGLIVVTESLLDAEVFYGIADAVGSYGVFNGQQVGALLELDPRGVVWAMDADQNKRILEFVKHTYGLLPTYVLPMFGDEDPNGLGPDKLQDRFDNLLKIDSLWDVNECLLYS